MISPQPPERPPPGPSLPASRHLVSLAMGACIVWYAWIVTSAAGDFQGDSWEYINIAHRMKHGGPDV
jgi:hypothetical protein